VSFGSDEVADVYFDAGRPAALLDGLLDSACISKHQAIDRRS